MTEEQGEIVTIDQLAQMVRRSFDTLEGKIDSTREDLKEFKDEVHDRFDKVDERFDQVEDQLERIENKVNTNQENRISRLEDDVRILKTTLGK